MNDKVNSTIALAGITAGLITMFIAAYYSWSSLSQILLGVSGGCGTVVILLASRYAYKYSRRNKKAAQLDEIVATWRQ